MHDAAWVSEWVEFNAPPDTAYVISEAVILYAHNSLISM